MPKRATATNSYLINNLPISPAYKVFLLSISFRPKSKLLSIALYSISQMQLLFMLSKLLFYDPSHTGNLIESSFKSLHGYLFLDNWVNLNSDSSDIPSLLALIFLYILYSTFCGVYLFRKAAQKKQVNQSLLSLWNLSVYTQPYILFYWLHQLTQQISSLLYINYNSSAYSLIVGIISFIFMVWNIAFSLLCLTVMHPNVQTSNYLTSKTALIDILDLILKIILPLLWTEILQMADLRLGLLILALVYCIARDFVLLQRLVYYKVQVLKLASVLQAILTAFVISLILVTALDFGEYISDTDTVLLLISWIICSLFIIWVYNGILNRLLLGILYRNFQKNENYAVHFYEIFKYFAKYSTNSDLARNKLNKWFFYYMLGIKQSGLSPSIYSNYVLSWSLDVHNDIKKYHIAKSIETLNPFASKEANNWLAKAALARFYIKKEKLYALGNEILNKSRMAPTAYKTSFAIINYQMQAELIERNLGQSSEGVDGLKDIITSKNVNIHEQLRLYDETVSISKGMINQLQYQIKLWEYFISPGRDFLTILMIGKEAYSHTKVINEILANYKKLIDLNIIHPLLILSLYALLIQNNLILGQKLLDEYFNLLTKHNLNNSTTNAINAGFSAASLVDEAAFVAVSTSPKQLGKILACSGKIENVFELSKDNLISHSVNDLMPSFYAKWHNNFLQTAYKDGGKGILNKMRNVMIKTRQNRLVMCGFYITFNMIKEHELCYYVLVKPIASQKRYLLVQPDGEIMNMSDNFKEDMRIDKEVEGELHHKMSLKYVANIENLFDFCPDLRKAFAENDKHSAMSGSNSALSRSSRRISSFIPQIKLQDTVNSPTSPKVASFDTELKPSSFAGEHKTSVTNLIDNNSNNKPRGISFEAASAKENKYEEVYRMHNSKPKYLDAEFFVKKIPSYSNRNSLNVNEIHSSVIYRVEMVKQSIRDSTIIKLSMDLIATEDFDRPLNQSERKFDVDKTHGHSLNGPETLKDVEEVLLSNDRYRPRDSENIVTYQDMSVIKLKSVEVEKHPSYNTKDSMNRNNSGFVRKPPSIIMDTYKNDLMSPSNRSTTNLLSLNTGNDRFAKGGGSRDLELIELVSPTEKGDSNVEMISYKFLHDIPKGDKDVHPSYITDNKSEHIESKPDSLNAKDTDIQLQQVKLQQIKFNIQKEVLGDDLTFERESVSSNSSTSRRGKRQIFIYNMIYNLITVRKYKRSTKYFNAIFIITFLLILSFLVIMNETADLVTNDVVKYGDLLENLNFRNYWLTVGNQDTGWYVSTVQGILVYDITVFVFSMYLDYTSVSEHNLAIQMNLSNFDQEFQQQFYEKNVKVYTRDDEKNLVLEGVYDTFEAANKLVEKALNKDLGPLPDIPSDDYLDTDAYYIFDNSANDLLVQSENLVSLVSNTIFDQLSNAKIIMIVEIVVMAIIFLLFILSSFYYVWKTNQNLNTLMAGMCTIPNHKIQDNINITTKFKNLLENDCSSLELMKGLGLASSDLLGKSKSVAASRKAKESGRASYIRNINKEKKLAHMRRYYLRNYKILSSLFVSMAIIIVLSFLFYNQAYNGLLSLQKEYTTITATFSYMQTLALTSAGLQTLLILNTTASMKDEPIIDNINNNINSLTNVLAFISKLKGPGWDLFKQYTRTFN